MKKVLFILFVFLNVSYLTAQRPGGRGGQRSGGERPEITIKGKIVDAISGNALEFATISVINKRDSSLAGGGLTEMDGSFEIKSKMGPLKAEIEFISFEKYIIDPLPFDREAMKSGNRTIDLGIIQMNQSSELLEEVEIRAEKSETQFSLDKKVFNVGKDLANRGGTAEDILDNVPSVTVDVEGNVSLRGSDGVKILIDGRVSGLAGGDNTNGLRNIPANMIEKVEVITNPSAKYEAEGMAGILNIVLKKEKGGGFNGSFDVNAGYPEQLGTGANINYRKGKVNWFANYGLRYRKNPGGGFSNQTLETDNGTAFQNITRDTERNGLSNSIRLGIDYLPTEKQTLTGALSYRRSDEDNIGALIYQDYLGSLDNLTRITTRSDDEFEEESNLEYSLNYTKEYSSRNHKLNVTAQYTDKVETEGSDYLEEVTFSSSTSDIADVIQMSNNEEGEKIWLFQADFVKPLKGDDHQIELGARSSLRDIDNDYRVEQLEDGAFVNLPGLTNQFEYDEDVSALYATYGNKFGKTSIQAGLRGEYSHVVTLLKQTNEVNDRSYANLFPSVHMNYEIAENVGLQLSYSQRIRRPRFWDLNPFFTFSDSRNTFSGNPNLNPEFTDSYEIGAIRYAETSTISGSFYYRYSTDVRARILTFNDDGTTTRRPENLAERDNYGLEVTYQYSGIDWWRISGDFNFFRSITDGGVLYPELQADTYSWTSRMTNRITLWDKSDLQLRLNYRAPRDGTQGRRNAITSIDIGWSKDIGKNGTLTFSVRDLLNSRKYAGTTIGDGFYREDEFQRRRRSMNLAFNYRINQKKKRGGGSRRDYQGGEEGEF